MTLAAKRGQWRGVIVGYLNNHRDAEKGFKMSEYSSFEMHELTFAVIGSAVEVHKILGPGYLEIVYEESLAHEFDLRRIPYTRQHPIGVKYKDKLVGEGRLDFIVDNRLIVELKAVEKLHPVHTAQAISYLKSTGHGLCLLINFNVSVLKEGIKRVILTT
jgi:GxxExxY protein